jgi:ERCC4-type nuclease
MVNCVWRDDIHVWTVATTAHCAEFVRRLLAKCAEFLPEDVVECGNLAQRRAHAASMLATTSTTQVSVHSKRNRNVTSQSYYADIVAAIEHVGKTRAALIVERWPTLPALVAELQRSPRALEELKGVGPQLARRIAARLLTRTEDEVKASATASTKKQKKKAEA